MLRKNVPVQNLIPFNFQEGEGDCPIVVKELPSIQTLTKSNLSKLEHIYRIAMENGELAIALRSVDTMHKIMITQPTNDDSNIDVTITL